MLVLCGRGIGTKRQVDVLYSIWTVFVKDICTPGYVREVSVSCGVKVRPEVFPRLYFRTGIAL